METPPEPGRGPDDDPRTPRDWLRHALRETMLWPVLGVVAMVATTVGAGVLLFAIAGRNLPGLAALVILAAVSIDVVQREVRGGGFGLLSGLVLGLWATSTAAALAALAIGLY